MLSHYYILPLCNASKIRTDTVEDASITRGMWPAFNRMMHK